jgi:hypothetical protein
VGSSFTVCSFRTAWRSDCSHNHSQALAVAQAFLSDGYACPELQVAFDRVAKFTLQIVKRTDTAKRFEVLSRL